jgi:hypothetical protein
LDVAIQLAAVGSETTLNYLLMMERLPNLKEEVGGLNPDYEISSLPDEKLARWSTASSTLALACRPFVSFIIIRIDKNKNNNNNNNNNNGHGPLPHKAHYQ